MRCCPGTASRAKALISAVVLVCPLPCPGVSRAIPPVPNARGEPASATRIVATGHLPRVALENGGFRASRGVIRVPRPGCPAASAMKPPRNRDKTARNGATPARCPTPGPAPAGPSPASAPAPLPRLSPDGRAGRRSPTGRGTRPLSPGRSAPGPACRPECPGSASAST
jgi:hypothetical protein